MTKDDFLAIVDEGIEKNKTIRTLKKDVSGLKKDVSELKKDVSGLKKDSLSLHETMHRFGILLEEVRDDIRLLAEAVSPLLKKTEGLGEMDERIKDNKDYMAILRANLKAHINDRAVHRGAESS